MSWISGAVRIALAALVATLLGWAYGYPLEALCLLLAGLVVFWLYQMQKVQRWLLNPHDPPPDTWGLWGSLLARMHSHERRHREVQQALQDNIDYLQDSFASMRDGVVMVDSSGAIKWLNQAVESLLGLHYPGDTGRVLTNLVRSPEFNRYFLSHDYSEPLQYVSGGEQARHLRVEITRFGEGDRLLFVRDVSEAVRMEKMRTDFVANVSHELRTPLTVISGYLGTFWGNRRDLPERYHKPLQQMSQNAARMENLLKDLLWLSRIEHEQHRNKRESVNIGGLLQELREELSDAFPDSDIKLQLDCECRIPGDYRELYSAFSNLVTNAIKYSPSGAPVDVRCYNDDGRCSVSVRDRGIGIDPMHLPRLTERFYRIDDSRSSATGGTGLGLAIVKHVTAAHDGELHIKSKPAKGSTFTLTFPGGATHGSEAGRLSAPHLSEV